MAKDKWRKVYVHAFEYVNGPQDGGGGGFDWFYKRQDARAAFEALEPNNPDWASFLFEYYTEEKTNEAITKEIDSSLHDLCAIARTRRVGANVLRYWKAGGFKMGDEKFPDPEAFIAVEHEEELARKLKSQDDVTHGFQVTGPDVAESKTTRGRLISKLNRKTFAVTHTWLTK